MPPRKRVTKRKRQRKQKGGGDVTSIEEWLTKVKGITEPLTNIADYKREELTLPSRGGDFNLTDAEEGKFDVRERGVVARFILKERNLLSLSVSEFQTKFVEFEEYAKTDIETKIMIEYLEKLESQLRSEEKIKITDKTKYPLYFLFLAMNVREDEIQMTPQLLHVPTASLDIEGKSSSGDDT